ncbi:MAG TPA: hypothetical protein VF099_02760 [Ktedonobacterales bacterium]
MLLVIARVVIFLLGLALVIATLFSAIRSFVLPRSANDRMARILFLSLRFVFNKLMQPMRSYIQRDALMAYYAPIGLLLLPVFWLTLVLIGYMGMFWALDQVSWHDAFRVSGSSLFTLGFATPNTTVSAFMTFSEALIGLVLIAILIAYLPTMYSAFSRREATVTLLEVRAGSPPSAIEMFERFRRLHRLEELNEIWVTWEAWFSELEESHTSLAALAFFRSPRPHRHWVIAAGAVLDAASLAVSTLDVPRDSHADLCIRAGYLALGHIAEYFKIPYNPHPKPTDSISVSRAEFDEACRRLAAADVPLKPDLDQAWRDFAGWRVNYDRVLIALAALTMAPEAPWSSDRLTKRRP